MAVEEGDEGGQAHSVRGCAMTVVGWKNGELDAVRARRESEKERDGGRYGVASVFNYMSHEV